MRFPVTTYSLLFGLALGLASVPALLPAQTSFAILTQTEADQRAELVSSGERWQKINAIFQDLIEAKGDYRLPPPQLVLVKNTKQQIAYLSENGRTIGLEEPALAVLDKYGDDGYAFVLGHEITHFYERHQASIVSRGKYRDWLVDSLVNKLTLTADSASLPTVHALNSAVVLSQQRLLTYAAETESDYLGGFLAYSAGYDVSRTSIILEDLYNDYGLDSLRMFGYAPMRERLAESQAAQEKMSNLVELFKAANLMATTGKHRDARFLYQKILQDYQSREVYNNLGVLTLMSALDLYPQSTMPYRLPFELDLKVRSGIQGGRVEDDRAALFEEAAGHFRNAIRLDENYATAYLNLACVHFLRKDFARARYFAYIEARQKALANPARFLQTVMRSDVLLALMAGDTATIADQLTPLAGNSDLARYNLEQIRKPAFPLLPSPANVPAASAVEKPPVAWTIGGLTPRKLKSKTRSTTGANSISLGDGISLRRWEKEAAYNLYKYRNPERGSQGTFRFATTKAGENLIGDQERNLGTGSTVEEIEATYRAPDKIVPYAGGWLHVYPSTILIVGSDRKVKSWVYYQQ